MMAHERIIQKVGVLGAGTMGAGIAQTFASAGMTVVLRDMDQAFVDRGVASIENNLGRLVAKGKLDPSDKRPLSLESRAPRTSLHLTIVT